jgi:FtsP/CotA-like multicopper oxidase with cupredoxin domain
MVGIQTSFTTRRKFMQGASAAFLGSLFCSSGQSAYASSGYNIVAQSRVLDVKGKAAKVLGLTVDGKWGGLRTRFGKPFSATVSNQLSEETLIHWHGLTPPVAMDGVPMLSRNAQKPGESVHYTFENRRTGTHWMHSHVGLQEQLLLAAPLIVEEDGEALVDEQEHTVMLHDFTFRDPAEILAELQGGEGLHAGHVAHGAASTDHSAHSAQSASPVADVSMLNDIAFDAMLANDRTLDDPEVVRSEKGGRFRLRIINGAAATNFWIDLGTIEGELIAVDGNAIFPVKGSRFPLAVAQRADIRLSLPAGSGAYPVLFQAEGSVQQSGIVLQSGDGKVEKIGEGHHPADALDLVLESQLKSVAGLPDTPVSRTEMLMLTGGGSDYVWGLNGKASMHDVLFEVREGERYEIMMHNMTGMAHPMHLHGHYFRVVGIDGKRFNGALRDTVLVPTGAAVTIQFDADNPGTWAFHCHHLYHMNSGMMGAVAYSKAA